MFPNVFFMTQQYDKESKEFRTKIAGGKALTIALAFLWIFHGLLYETFEFFFKVQMSSIHVPWVQLLYSPPPAGGSGELTA